MARWFMLPNMLAVAAAILLLLPCRHASALQLGLPTATFLRFAPVFFSGRKSPVLRHVAPSHDEATANDPSEMVAKRILVRGDVGGYYRQCVVNEAGRFRRLVGTMSPPDDASREAEIYVEGKRKMVDGFLRWCQKGDVGLSQVVKVIEVVDEEPTGLYDAFYAKVRDDSS